MRKNDAFVAKIVITRLTKGFMAIFAPAESLPSPATLDNVILFVDHHVSLLCKDLSSALLVGVVPEYVIFWFSW